MNRSRASFIIVSLAILAVLACEAGIAQETAASPELVGQLTKQLAITPAQATGGAGALFSAAKTRLPAADFSKVAAAVPGMSSFLKAAPPTDATAFSGLAGSLPGGMGALASTAGSFQKLGLSPSMATKFVPILTGFVESKGGTEAASLLAGALK